MALHSQPSVVKLPLKTSLLLRQPNESLHPLKDFTEHRDELANKRGLALTNQQLNQHQGNAVGDDEITDDEEELVMILDSLNNETTSRASPDKSGRKNPAIPYETLFQRPHSSKGESDMNFYNTTGEWDHPAIT
eukprot:CAMPEP_0172492582 /NCGR_PEP_ID=MMETSP1066-20121228/23796_1 /TAXON_ID=671091 /ORGANISM="Coscinodiscus wailesii, Strain CCMP2513" /LENGTH=133 /DNA_ID=CAMNT_0013262291 /DNA_START=15 /DNA_END=412 /DNA_ORIENTATION=+